MITKCLKLKTGEEIIVDIVEETDSVVKVKNPFVLAIVGEGQLALMSWLPLAAEQVIEISREDVRLTYLPKQDFINHYKERTGGIVTVSPGVLNQLESWRK